MSKEWTQEQRQKATEQVIRKAYAEAQQEDPEFDHEPYIRRDIKRASPGGQGTSVGSDVAVDLQCELNEALELLEFLEDDEVCRLDHHGYCQNHGLSESPCYMPILRAWLARNRTLEVS